MSKFDYMEFSYDGGTWDELVFHAKKFTKEQAIEAFCEEYEYLIKEGKIRKPIIEDITEANVRYFIRVPQTCSSDISDTGCYSYCGANDRGRFPVFVITRKDLKV